MISHDIKYYINKIDSDLKNLFENVKINEKSEGNRFFFEIPCEGIFENLENSKKVRAKTIIRINKSDLLQNKSIKWEYFTNPKDQIGGFWLERFSSLDSIATDIYKTISEKRMDKDYFNSLEPQEEIYESPIESNLDKIITLVEKFGLKVVGKGYEKSTKSHYQTSKGFDGKKTTIYIIELDGSIKMSDRFKIESELKKMEGFEGITFKIGDNESHLLEVILTEDIK